MNDIVLAPPWELNETIRAKNMMIVLHKQYPGHRWVIGMPRGGGVIIRNFDIPTYFSVFIRPQDLDEPHYKVIMRQAGLMLEAFKLSRGRFKLDEYELLERKKGGLIMPDHNALPPKNLSRQIKASINS